MRNSVVIGWDRVARGRLIEAVGAIGSCNPRVTVERNAQHKLSGRDTGGEIHADGGVGGNVLGIRG